MASDEEIKIDVVMAVGDQLVQPSVKRRTMKVKGKVGNQDVLILVDSGSVATSISEQLADKLQCYSKPCVAVNFLTVDGSSISCSKRIPALEWIAQGHVFSIEAGILALKCYDMIVGADWLEECSPMWLHWKKKIMKFTYKVKRVTLCMV